MENLEKLKQNLRKSFEPIPLGIIEAIDGGMLRVGKLSHIARVGDFLELEPTGGAPLTAEVLKLSDCHIWAIPDRPIEGLKLGETARLLSQPELMPSDNWIGRVVDPFGRALDNRPIHQGNDACALLKAPPPATNRRPLGDRFESSLSVINTILPIAKGQRIGLFAGSGVGKSHLLAQFTKKMDADLTIVALVGERGREVGDFVNKTLGPDGMEKAIVVAATSDQSALMRRRCAWSAMSIAEHFRDQGKSVLLLMDSVTRFAEAHREVAFASGEGNAMRGFPPSTMPTIANLCERAGPGTDGQGTITAIFTVLVAGSDMNEPVADILRGNMDASERL